MTLRDYNAGDEHSVQALVQEVLADFQLELHLDQIDQDITDIQRHYLEPGSVFRVLEHDSRIIGCCGLYRLSQNQCELRKMYFLQDYQGQGLGRMLLDDSIEIARQKQFQEMVLETNSILEKAIQLYQRNGFEFYQRDELSSRCNMAMKRNL